MTAENLILEKKKNLQTEQKIIINYARNLHVLRHTLWKIFKHYFLRL